MTHAKTQNSEELENAVEKFSKEKKKVRFESEENESDAEGDIKMTGSVLMSNSKRVRSDNESNMGEQELKRPTLCDTGAEVHVYNNEEEFKRVRFEKENNESNNQGDVDMNDLILMNNLKDEATYELKKATLWDTGAETHVCNNIERFISLVPCKDKLCVGDTETEICGYGTVILRPFDQIRSSVFEFLNVAYSPGFHTNIISA